MASAPSTSLAPNKVLLAAAAADHDDAVDHTDGTMGLAAQLDFDQGDPTFETTAHARQQMFALQFYLQDHSGALPPMTGTHDLCFSFTAKKLDPIWVIDWIQLVPKG